MTHPPSKNASPLGGPADVESCTARELTLLLSGDLPAASLLECELLLGARPIAVTLRVLDSRPAGARYRVRAEFLVIAQEDRDDLADVLQAVGPSVLRVRPRRKD